MPTPEEKHREAVRNLYKVIGASEARCQGCGRNVWWIIDQNDKASPYTDEGIHHVSDCPKAAKFS